MTNPNKASTAGQAAALPADLRRMVDVLADSIARHAEAALAMLDEQENTPHVLPLRATVAHMGWMADQLVRRMSPNGTSCRGGADAWLMQEHEAEALRAQGGAA